MFLPIVAALILVPLAELYVIIEVGSAIGVLPTIGLLLASSVVGAILLQHQGARAWRVMRIALVEHRLPHREVADGALVVLGSALMLAPGFITDVLGLLLLLPPTRAVVRLALLRIVARRVSAFGATGHLPGDGGGTGQGGTGRGGPPPEVIDGEVEER
jgi:UPF0716 protein FxsA